MYVTRTVLRCFAAVQLRQIRHSVPAAIFQTLVTALVHSWLDYGNAVLAGLPAYLQRRLQSVLNAPARFRDRITNALVCLHWLRVPQRNEFKLAVLTYELLSNQALHYLGPLVHVADLSGRRALRSANTDRLLVPSIRMSPVGARAYPVAAPRIWNDLPNTIISAQSLHALFPAPSQDLSFSASFSDIVTPE